MRFASLTALLMLAACGSTGPVSYAVPGHGYHLKRGETLHMVDGFSIEFTRVVNDGRCPTNLTCIWAGDAVVELTVKSRANSAVLEIHTASIQLEGGRIGNVAGFEGWIMTLEELEPWPVADGQATGIAGEYTARLFVDRKHE